MQKILEFKNEDWVKGISYQPNLPVGGLFERMTGINPFENMGIAKPSLSPTSITPTTTPKFLTNFSVSGTAYLYYHTNTKLYQVTADSPYTQTDKTAEINVSTDIIGTTIWRNKYIYAQKTTGAIRSNSIPVASGSDVAIASYVANASDYMPFCIGADANLYFGLSNGVVGILTNESGTSGNSGYIQIEFTQNIRDLVNDGRYLVIISDSNAINTADRKAGNFKCKVSFWDMFKSTCDIVYDIEDSFLVGAEIIDGVIYVIGNNGVYACNSATMPRLIRPFSDTNANISARPMNPSQIDIHNGSIYWLDGRTNSNTGNTISAYGNPITGQPKIFYQPYIDTGSPTTTTKQCMAMVGETIWVADSTPKIWIHNTGTTRGTGTITNCGTTLPTSFTYGFTKVVLDAPLASGQSVTLTIIDNAGQTITSETKSYSASNPRSELLFLRTPTTNSPNEFDDFYLTIAFVGVGMRRVTVYGTAQEDNSSNI